MRQGLLVCLLFLLAWLPGQSEQTAQAQAIESRCTELGAACVCSEPLNASLVTSGKGGHAYDWDTNVVKVKPCDAGDGWPIVRNVQDLTMTSSATFLGKLPAAHTNAFMMTYPDGTGGTLYIGEREWGPTDGSKRRLANRFYRCYTNTFVSGNYGFKMFEMWNQGVASGGAIPTLSGTGTPSTYNFLYWSSPQDCCNHACDGCVSPGAAYFNDSCHRTEVIVINPGGDGVASPGNGPVIKVYDKNVTTGAAEILLIDTSQNCTGCVAGGANFSPTSQFRKVTAGVITGMVYDDFRQAPLSGSMATGYVLAAMWDTDNNQRIGAATEVEGGGDTVAPSIPQNLRIVSLSQTVASLAWDASTDNVGVLNYFVEHCAGSGCSSYTQVGAPSTISYIDAPLLTNTPYSFRVRATDAAGNLSAYSGTLAATTDTVKFHPGLNLRRVYFRIQEFFARVFSPPALVATNQGVQP